MKTIVISLTSISSEMEEKELEEGDVFPEEEDDLWVVSDDGEDWDDSEELPLNEAEGEVLDRLSHYESTGFRVTIFKNGIPQGE